MVDNTHSTLEDPQLNLSQLMSESIEMPHLMVGSSSDSEIFKYKGYSDKKGTIDYYWVIGDNYHDGTINLDEFSIGTRLACYGLSQQAKFSDNNDECPSMFNIKGYKKWNAWDRQRGRPQEDARKDFIMHSEAILAYKGIGAYEGRSEQVMNDAKSYMDKVKDQWG